MTSATKISSCTIACYPSLQLSSSRVQLRLRFIWESSEWTITQKWHQDMVHRFYCTTWIIRWFKHHTGQGQSCQLWRGGSGRCEPAVCISSLRCISSNRQEERFRSRSKEPKLEAFLQIDEQRRYGRTLLRSSCSIWMQTRGSKLWWPLNSFVDLFHHRVTCRSQFVMNKIRMINLWKSQISHNSRLERKMRTCSMLDLSVSGPMTTEQSINLSTRTWNNWGHMQISRGDRQL